MKAQEEARAELASRGVKFIKFSDADATAFLRSLTVRWDALEAQLPDKFGEIQKLFNLTVAVETIPTPERGRLRSDPFPWYGATRPRQPSTYAWKEPAR